MEGNEVCGKVRLEARKKERQASDAEDEVEEASQ